MSKEIDIIREVDENGDEYFPQTHAEAVIDLDDKIEEAIKNGIPESIILRSPQGQRFMLTVDEEGKLDTIRL